MRNLNDKIPGAPNFKYKEFVFSNTTIRKNISNIPYGDQWKNIERLAINVLQPIRDKFGSIRITSGFRCSELNEMIGGSKYSNHCRGEASDIISLRDVPLIEIAEWSYNNLSFRTLIFEFNEWLHFDYREEHNIKKLKLKSLDYNYKNVSIECLKSLYYESE
jgi:hypothetical protein